MPKGNSIQYEIIRKECVASPSNIINEELLMLYYVAIKLQQRLLILLITTGNFNSSVVCVCLCVCVRSPQRPTRTHGFSPQCIVGTYRCVCVCVCVW